MPSWRKGANWRITAKSFPKPEPPHPWGKEVQPNTHLVANPHFAFYDLVHPSIPMTSRYFWPPGIFLITPSPRGFSRKAPDQPFSQSLHLSFRTPPPMGKNIVPPAQHPVAPPKLKHPRRAASTGSDSTLPPPPPRHQILRRYRTPGRPSGWCAATLPLSLLSQPQCSSFYVLFTIPTIVTFSMFRSSIFPPRELHPEPGTTELVSGSECSSFRGKKPTNETQHFGHFLRKGSLYF